MAGRRGEGSPINGLIAAGIGVLVLVAIVIMGPVLAGSIQGAVPAMPADSDWNGTHNADLPNGVSLWTSAIGLVAVCVTVFLIMLAIYYIRLVG